MIGKFKQDIASSEKEADEIQKKYGYTDKPLSSASSSSGVAV